ncbi:MAG TPA: hypothetical protein VGR57_11620, partial [Ktedonobacterales bacterium]|nr:hypothetical protein [Ktedonobacterales bacterium]
LHHYLSQYHVWRVSAPELAHTQRPRASWAALSITVLIGLVAVLLVTAPLGRTLALLTWYVTVIALMILQLVRYWRVAGPLERQQTKWAAFGLSIFYALAFAVLAPELFLPALSQAGSFYQMLHTLILIVASVMGPVAIAFAILRYRLWDIDVLIRRTLLYGSLSAILAAVFVGIVLGAQAVVQAFTGETGQQPVFIVASTLVSVALFTPLRQRLQALIDRRFYRRKYDAARTLAAFGAVLHTETDLAALSARLVAMVEATMQPVSVALWLRPPDRRVAHGPTEDWPRTASW